MPFNTYAELQESVLNWLARPADPLVAPFVPEMIRLFEAEATRRLRVGGAETRATVDATGTPVVSLPGDCCQLRSVATADRMLLYAPPGSLPGGSGSPEQFTLYGNTFLVLGPAPSGECLLDILYQSGVPPLGDSNTSNWLLETNPDIYLYGTLASAEAFIGHDERIPLWLQAREAAFASIEQADRKARWSGSPLQIGVDGITTGHGGGGGGGPPLPPGGAVVTVSATAPLHPRNGAGWWDSVSGQLYIFYDDGTSAQWVAATN